VPKIVKIDVGILKMWHSNFECQLVALLVQVFEVITIFNIYSTIWVIIYSVWR